ncbi:MAG: hypothetical protein HY651_02045 [Acidobacteria bacterium]|nr:hypothetical protein [Acidobacteriota bacterium]
MHSFERDGGLSQLSRNSKRVSAIAVFAALIISLQLSRFYIAAQMDPLLCPWDPPRHAQAKQDHTHAHPGDASLAIPVGQDGGYTLEHCKDTFYGVYLAPAQTLDLPVATAIYALTTHWADSVPVVLSMTEGARPKPFQPPRITS